MHALKPHRGTLPALLIATALVLGLAAPATAGSPAQIAPKSGSTLTAGSQPTFKIRDASASARRYGVFITVSTSKALTRRGDLKKTNIGTFAKMKRRGSVYSYKTPLYSFPTWFMVRPGTYYWQAFRIDCSVKGCHVHTKVRSFKVQ